MLDDRFNQCLKINRAYLRLNQCQASFEHSPEVDEDDGDYCDVCECEPCECETVEVCPDCATNPCTCEWCKDCQTLNGCSCDQQYEDHKEKIQQGREEYAERLRDGNI